MTPAEAMDVGSKLIHMLSQQQLLYRQLRDLAAKQSTLVEGGDPEMILRILAGRQRLIDRLTALNRELEPIRTDWQNVMDSLPTSQRQEAQSLVASVQEILGEILASDERDTKTLQSQQQKIAGEIKGASVGKRVNRAYVQNVGGSQRRLFDATSG